MRHVLPLEAFLHRLLTVNDYDPGYITRFRTSTFNDFTNRIEGIDANIANGCGLRSMLQETHISKKSKMRSSVDSIIKCIQRLL